VLNYQEQNSEHIEWFQVSHDFKLLTKQQFESVKHQDKQTDSNRIVPKPKLNNTVSMTNLNKKRTAREAGIVGDKVKEVKQLKP